MKEMLDISGRSYIPWRTAGRDFFFMKYVGPWEAPTLELGRSVRRKQCQKGTVMTTATTPACHYPALLAAGGEEIEEESGMKNTESGEKKKEVEEEVYF